MNGLCATCGKPLSDSHPTDGVVLTVKADDGFHHGGCWGKPKRDRIAELEAGLRRAIHLIEVMRPISMARSPRRDPARSAGRVARIEAYSN